VIGDRVLKGHSKRALILMARTGVLNVKSLHFPYGARRGVPFNSITAKRFTGQYHEASLPGGEGLSFYNARWYDPKLGAFLCADSIVPAPLDPQSFNRYAYAGGNPLRFSDPSGHMKLCGAACEDEYKWSPVTKKGGGGTGGSISPGVAKAVTRVRTTTHPSVGESGLDRPGWGYYRLPPAPTGFAWVPVVTDNGSTRIKITAYITVLESDRDAYAGPMVPIPGLDGSTPLIPQGMLDDLWEEGSLKLLDGRYIQRNWPESTRQRRPVYMRHYRE
jgi:RHS repeat-associated protein